MGVVAVRIGTRPVAPLGVAVTAGAFALAATAQSLWQLFVVFFLGSGPIDFPVAA